MSIVSFSNIDAAWTVAIHFIPPSFPLSAEDPDTPRERVRILTTRVLVKTGNKQSQSFRKPDVARTTN